MNSLRSLQDCPSMVPGVPSTVLSPFLFLATIVFLAGVALTAGATSTKAQGQLSLSPDTLNFGTVTLGHSRALSMTLKNSGSSNVVFAKEMVEGMEFNVVGFSLPMTLEPGKESTLIVEFDPRSVGDVSGTIVLESDAAAGAVYVPLRGVGTDVATAATENEGSQPSSAAAGTAADGAFVPAGIAIGGVEPAAASSTANLGSVETSGENATFKVVATPVTSMATTAAVTTATKIALVQRTGVDARTASSAKLAFPSSNTAGNWIGVAVRSGAQNETFTISDSHGNTYRKAFQFNQSLDNDTVALFYAENIAGGTNTVTVSQSSSQTLRLAILEYSGVATSGSIDKAVTAQGSSSTPNSGSAVTTTNGDLLLGLVVTADGETYTAGSGYKLEQSVPAAPNTKLMAEDQIQASAGTISASASLGGSNMWGAGLAAFKASTTSTGTGGSTSVSATPSSAVFNNVPVGTSNSQTVQLKNVTSSSAVISSASTQGTGFGTSGLTTPLTLAAGATSTFNVTFKPTSAGTIGGMLTLAGGSSNSGVTVPLVGSAVTTVRLLTPNPTSISFGNVAVSGFSTLNLLLTNGGNSAVTVQSVSTSGTGFSSTGVATNTSVNPGQTAVLAVEFSPKVTGSVTGSVTIATNATSGATFSVPLTATGVTASSTHSVQLSWGASASSGVVGYYVYRSTVSGSSYSKIVSAPVNGTSYTDRTVQSGVHYYYVVTSVTGSGIESTYSNQTTALIP